MVPDSKGHPQVTSEALGEAGPDLLDFEDDLRALQGSVSALRAMSRSSEAIEPEAIAVVSTLAQDSLDKVKERWLQLLQKRERHR
jgi:hypothetical protein